MNNRILKFRIWDKQKLYWVPDNILLLNTKGELGYNTNRGWYKIPDTGQKDLGIDRYVIQQFTGLLDTNGKEIYEGDIVLEVWDENRPYGYSPDEIISCSETYEIIYTAPKFKFYNRIDSQTFIENYTMRVVGNIFENTELLK